MDREGVDFGGIPEEVVDSGEGCLDIEGKAEMCGALLAVKKAEGCVVDLFAVGFDSEGEGVGVGDEGWVVECVEGLVEASERTEHVCELLLVG